MKQKQKKGTFHNVPFPCLTYAKTFKISLYTIIYKHGCHYL